MIKLFIRYINLMVITIFALVLLSFMLPFFFPGDLLTNISGITPQSLEQRQALEKAFALNESIFVQFQVYLSNFFAGDWGVSSVSQLNLYDEIAYAFPATLELMLYALFVATFVGIPVGFLSGLKHHNPADMGVVTFSIVGYSFPVFWLALVFITLFCLQLEWLPMSGRIDLLFEVKHITGFVFIDIILSDLNNTKEAIENAFRHAILPTLSISIVTTCLFIRFTRRSIMDVMQKGYIIAAKSRGFTQWQIFIKHSFKNALIPILPILALQISTLVTNAMIVETIFSWPGIGNWLIQAIYQQDYPAIRAGMLVVALFVLTLTITLEFITRAIDPTKDETARAAV
ncbi:peptide transport system permease protein sapB [Glaciecola punicea ACAM 611]|jgi:cationic peptide transport system permease protein|uniref:Peptide transport system permease protein sapB n=1 Tax=Glaciecola punicea ACAM 611 TaxID=1121923 RepID=H5TBA6_9ALTE|nr:ABC transporter permease [Glaciecola punicea]OFA30044.1 peptide ABC transporter permease [Glaciecola punicea]GAB55583.1 peptide transport system permease protein sapB [Glaciecola punicea ACAM 611]